LPLASARYRAREQSIVGKLEKEAQFSTDLARSLDTLTRAARRDASRPPPTSLRPQASRADAAIEQLEAERRRRHDSTARRVAAQAEEFDQQASRLKGQIDELRTRRL
jgi:hypothetical protein